MKTCSNCKHPFLLEDMRRSYCKKCKTELEKVRNSIRYKWNKQNNIPIAEYTPLQVKMSATGYGKATKKQVQEMVKKILKLNVIPKPDDAADALAIAICHSANVTDV
jgi:crossover junction endodeoxyribonuclease RuvC